MFALLLAAGIATAAAAAPAQAAATPEPPAPASTSPAATAGPGLDEAAHAIAAGRLDQARAMVAAAVAAGASGAALDTVLADLAYADGRHGEALTRYRALFAAEPANARFAERAAVSALREGKPDDAASLAAAASQVPGATWRAWNIIGVCADRTRDWPAADAAYARAAELAPDAPEVPNNQGWSQLLRGAWAAAIPPLERAAELQPGTARIANNLELARAAVAEDLPGRRAGEGDQAWAARLNDAGVLARLSGDNARAVAAFTRAIEAQGRWYERAWNNLAEARQAQ